MKLKLFVVFTLLIVSGCILLPPDYNFQATLINDTGNNPACRDISPAVFVDGGNSEVLTIQFRDDFEIIELTPEGDKRSSKPVRWSRLSYDESQRLAYLSTPQEASIGDFRDLVDKQLCVTFSPELFKSDEFDVQKYKTLSGSECCGILMIKE